MRTRMPSSPTSSTCRGCSSPAAIETPCTRQDPRVHGVSIAAGEEQPRHVELVGAMLNANPDAVISHELDVSRLFLAGCDRNAVYSRILARAGWFNLRGNRSNYEYQIP